ncbi:hypothetical protein SDC9_131662 [bioreactor metagenome]|uniref:Uncharacterized protein n=2 Tax=root TaxID=1 RepID=A0A645D5V4_9ZZZZ
MVIVDASKTVDEVIDEATKRVLEIIHAQG